MWIVIKFAFVLGCKWASERASNAHTKKKCINPYHSRHCFRDMNGNGNGAIECTHIMRLQQCTSFHWLLPTSLSASRSKNRNYWRFSGWQSNHTWRSQITNSFSFFPLSETIETIFQNVDKIGNTLKINAHCCAIHMVQYFFQSFRWIKETIMLAMQRNKTDIALESKKNRFVC